MREKESIYIYIYIRQKENNFKIIFLHSKHPVLCIIFFSFGKLSNALCIINFLELSFLSGFRLSFLPFFSYFPDRFHAKGSWYIERQINRKRFCNVHSLLDLQHQKAVRNQERFFVSQCRLDRANRGLCSVCHRKG